MLRISRQGWWQDSGRSDGGRTSIVFPIINDGRAALPQLVAAASRSATREESRGEAAPVESRGGEHGWGLRGGGSDFDKNIDFIDVVGSGSVGVVLTEVAL